MARKYHTVAEYDFELKEWFDGFGSYSIKEAKEEAASLKYDGKREKLAAHDAVDLREDSKLREETAKEAARIADAIADQMGWI